MKKRAMKKSDAPRFDDTRVTEGSCKVFVDLGFDEAEAKMMALRVELMVRLREHLAGTTQAEAAKLLGVTQPRVSALLKGTWRDFSIDMLLKFAARAGMNMELRLAA